MRSFFVYVYPGILICREQPPLSGSIRPMIRFPILLISALAGLMPALATAGGFGTSDIGPRRGGMLAVTARPDDTTAIMHNPAGLADQRGNRLQLSGMVGFRDIEARFLCEPWMEPYDLRAECEEREYSRLLRPESSYLAAPFLGASFDLDPYVENLVVAVAAHAPNLRRFSVDEFSLGRFQGIDSSLLTAFATGVLSYRPSRYVSIGAGASYLYLSAESWRRIVFHREEWDLKLIGRDLGVQLHFGVLLEPVSWASMGVGLDTEVSLDTSGEIRLAGVNHHDYDNHDINFYVMRQETALVIPQHIKSGINLRPTSWVEIGVDYYFWRFGVVTDQVTVLTATEDSHGIALLLDGNELVVPKRMSNSHALAIGTRVGIRRSPLPLWLMGGLRYDWAPGDDRHFDIELLYVDAYGLALGFDTQALPWLQVGMAWNHDRFVPIDITESEASPPANVRASAHSNQLHLSLQASF